MKSKRLISAKKSLRAWKQAEDMLSAFVSTDFYRLTGHRLRARPWSDTEMSKTHIVTVRIFLTRGEKTQNGRRAIIVAKIIAINC